MSGRGHDPGLRTGTRVGVAETAQGLREEARPSPAPPHQHRLLEPDRRRGEPAGGQVQLGVAVDADTVELLLNGRSLGTRRVRPQDDDGRPELPGDDGGHARRQDRHLGPYPGSCTSPNGSASKLHLTRPPRVGWEGLRRRTAWAPGCVALSAISPDGWGWLRQCGRGPRTRCGRRSDMGLR